MKIPIKSVRWYKRFKENNPTEWGGRVVKGINTTVDVGVDAIKKAIAKMGFKVILKMVYLPLLHQRI